MSSLQHESVVGNYLQAKDGWKLDMNASHRKEMVCLIEKMHSLKSYRLETLYLAVNIADRYLSRVNKQRL